MVSSHPLTPPPGTEVYRTRTAEIWIGPDDIARLKIVASEDPAHTLADADENINAIPPEKRRPRPILIDLRRGRSISHEARMRYREAPHLTAVALLVDSPISRVIGSVFLGIAKLPVPTRLFTSAAQAIKWLEPFRIPP